MLIMLVESDKDDLRRLKELIAESYPQSDILSFSDSKKALECICSEKFVIDMCFTDVVMPRVSGFGLVNELRRHNKRAKLVLMSDTPDFAEEAWKHYVNDYLLKPLTKDSVRRTLISCSEKADYESGRRKS